MRPRKSINQINVVPYIDVMLVLLVIFMVTAPLITPGTIDLPTIGSKPQVPVAPLEITVEGPARFLLTDRAQAGRSSRASTLNDLVQTVVDRQRERPDQAIVIAARGDVNYQQIVDVLDALKRAGAQKVGLLVKQAQ